MIDSNVVVAMFAVAMGAVWFVHQDLKADIRELRAAVFKALEKPEEPRRMPRSRRWWVVVVVVAAVGLAYWFGTV